MQIDKWYKKIQLLFARAKSGGFPQFSNRFVLLTVFLLAVILISFFIPIIHFGRFFGTDDYSHLFHTQQMYQSTGISDFYERMGNFVANPTSGDNLYNYPFGLWLFGSIIAKVTGLQVITSIFIFICIFLLIIVGTFYTYSGAFLATREQKILAVLFLISMPNMALLILSYRPSVFILPFLFLLIFIAIGEPFQWKLLPVIWLMIFIIIISHTGTFIFLVSFSILFYLLYCIIWGRSSLPMFVVIVSTFIIYILSLAWFPEILSQYADKSTLFLSPGNYLAAKFDIHIPLELGNIFYQNVVVSHELVYALVLGAFVFALGKVFRFVHRKIWEHFNRPETKFLLTLPLSNISHSVISTPLWAGPLQVIFSLIGLFRLDRRGKCLLLSVFIVAVLPDILFPTAAATGALRDISFLVVIIPITSVLGFCGIISFLEEKYPRKKNIQAVIWAIVLITVIITATLATTYYLPKISGEDYIIGGMQWMGNYGEQTDKVVGFGYRQVPIYTNMSDATYGLENGYETRTFMNLLSDTFFSGSTTSVDDLQQLFGIKYIMTSDKIAANLGRAGSQLLIDQNTELNKIYSSKDYGVYDVITPKNSGEKTILGGNVTLQKTGYSIAVSSDVYKIVLNENYPVIEQFGTPTDNYLGDGFFFDIVQISGLRQPAYINPFVPVNTSAVQNGTIDIFGLNDLRITPTIVDNKVLYSTILKDPDGNNEASLSVQYTFYPTTIKREVFISNDWITNPAPTEMKAELTTDISVPMSDFVITGNGTLESRHIYPSQDDIKLTGNIEDLYLYSGDRGIYLKNEPTAPFPSQVMYKGSTQYNISTISYYQADSLKPGATLHITQFLTPGDQETAKQDVSSQDSIRLLNYPDGIVPIMLVGYRSPDADMGQADFISQGYAILSNDSIPYSEAVIPEQLMITPATPENSTESSVVQPGIPQNTTRLVSVDLQSIKSKGIKIVGSSQTVQANVFNNYSTQENDIGDVIQNANEQGATLIGYMPAGLNYNFDTFRILMDEKFPLILSTYVSPPYFGIPGQEVRDPDLATYNGKLTDIVLLPVSSPTSSALSTQTDPFSTLAAWKATIDDSVTMNEMAVFIIRSADLGNPAYSDDIQSLISYAESKGLVFTTPDFIADHYQKVRNIQYTGSVQNDVAQINVTNNNDEDVQNIAFMVTLPILEQGMYNVSNGRIVRIAQDSGNTIIWVSTDITAHQNQKIIVQPAELRQNIVVNVPKYPIEGPLHISLTDEKGQPLTNAEVIVDTRYYPSDENGGVTINLHRGVHTLQIQCPGFNTVRSSLNVKGRIYGIIDTLLNRKSS